MASSPAAPDVHVHVPIEEDSEDVEQQKTELEMLQSIYTNREIVILKEGSEYLVCN